MNLRPSLGALPILCRSAIILCSVGITAQLPPPSIEVSHRAASEPSADDSAQVVSLIQHAETGDVTAQYGLGTAYADGHGIQSDYTKAIGSRTEAAQHRDQRAQDTFGSHAVKPKTLVAGGDLATGGGLQHSRTCVQKLDEDRPLFDDINRLTSLAKEGRILDAAKGVLPLGRYRHSVAIVTKA